MTTHETTKRTPRNKTSKQHKKLLKNRSARNKKNVNTKVHEVNIERLDKSLIKIASQQSQQAPQKNISMNEPLPTLPKATAQRVLKHSA